MYKVSLESYPMPLIFSDGKEDVPSQEKTEEATGAGGSLMNDTDFMAKGNSETTLQ